MRSLERAALAGLLALVAAAIVGLYYTSGTPRVEQSRTSQRSSTTAAISLDQHYLSDVRRLAATATTADEQRAAKGALGAADHELDLAYAYALQMEAIEPPPASPAVRSIQERIGRIESAIHSHQTSLAQIERDVPRLQGARQTALKDQVAVSRAELTLLQETLADAKADLAQAGGDPQSRVQALKAEHDAASRAADTFTFPPVQGEPVFASLLARWSYWRSTIEKRRAIEQAERDASAAAAGLQRQLDSLQQHVTTEQARRTALSGNPAILLIQHLSSDQILLRLLAGRTQSMTDLASAYATWDRLIQSDDRPVLHGLIAGGLWVVLILAIGILASLLTERVFAGLSLERKQRATLQAVVRMTIRLLVLVIVVMVALGTPSKLSTIIGLVGAGLAVALQDFILSFLGWFVLMGRHGIRVGDFVEINANAFSGVRGEVVEITLFRTVLLETGNWTEPGHLTGREVAFMNMYAVSGYYFNFSTTGQWLWDELQVAIPAGQDPYPLIATMQTIVARQTEVEAEAAEREWQHLSHRYGTRSFSAQPTVSLKLSDHGLMTVIRYLVRADERLAVQQRLSHDVVRLFHHGETLVSDETTPAANVTPATNA